MKSTFIIGLFVMLLHAYVGHSLHSVDKLYRPLDIDTRLHKLPQGEDIYEFIKLGTPVYLYSEQYDHIYVSHDQSDVEIF